MHPFTALFMVELASSIPLAPVRSRGMFTRDSAIVKARLAPPASANLHGIGFQGRDGAYQSLVPEEAGEAFVAGAVEGRRAQREAGQGVAPGASVELVVQVLVGLDEEGPAGLGVV